MEKLELSPSLFLAVRFVSISFLHEAFILQYFLQVIFSMLLVVVEI